MLEHPLRNGSFEQADKGERSVKACESHIDVHGWRKIWRNYCSMEDLSFLLFSKFGHWLSTGPGSLLVDAVSPGNQVEAKLCLATCEPFLLSGS